MRRHVLLLYGLALALFLLPAQLLASGATPLVNSISKRVFFRGLLSEALHTSDGEHQFRIRLFAKDSALVHEEVLKGVVRNGNYDLILGSTSPLTADLQEEYNVGITVDNQKEVIRATKFSPSSIMSEDMLDIAIRSVNRPMPAFDPMEITAQMAEREALRNGTLVNTIVRLMPQYSPLVSHVSGLKMEMSLAPPDAPNGHYYEMAKYGRIGVEYNNFLSIDGNNYGLAAQALHVAHHLLLYSAGVTSDINNDGMFLFTFGGAHYQIGNSRAEEFVNAPFMRFKFQSSPSEVFLYSELETTMHFRSYISGTMGLGFRLSESVNVIGGFHHTEFVMPTERMTRMVEGLHGIINWGL